ncbi:beta-carotene 15,15'-dioxygenase, Brp/Blh family [Pseudomonas fulva]|uniref:beta-carotene 15,15'-dioxygenase, Brp/Blh family n=1 Tax=Pseudomonas fulva TaxID=47880 RepID=UPI003CFA0926
MTCTGRSWRALVGLAIAASLAGGLAPLAYVLLVGLGLGLLHGASDLYLIEHGQRRRFVLSYLGVAIVCALVWQVAGALALTAFLLLSVWHFAHEDEVFQRRHEQIALGLFILGGPAVLHSDAVARLLNLAMAAGASSALGGWLAVTLACAGLIAFGVLLMSAWQQRDLRLALTLLLVVVTPPLIGFALGFYLLHAEPQTRVRERMVGALSMGDYLHRTWPVLVGAGMFALVGGAVFWQQEQTGIRALFVVLAAFALPHMVVLPRFLSGRAVPQVPGPV